MSEIQLFGLVICCLILVYAWLIGNIISVQKEIKTTSLEGENQDVNP